MTHPDSLPLPEIHAVSGDFSRAWTRFELVAKAKEWDDGKQLSILPTLLRGKLIDYYIDLPEDIKGDLKKLRDTLQEKAGLAKDPFSASMAFNTRNQKDDERAGDFAIELTKLFKQAYPEENTMSTVLLQRFVTGLRPSISRQLLLRKRPDNLEHAIKDAVEIEQTLSFHAVDEDQTDLINAVANKTPSQASSKDDSQLTTLHQALEKVTQRLESLETQLQRQFTPH